MSSGSQEHILQNYRRDLLMQFVAGKVRDVSLREDLVQETFVRLIDYGRGNTIGNWVALARKIAVNLINDHFRDRHQHPTDAIDETHPSDVPLQDNVLLHRQRLSIFKQTLEKMPPLRREVLIRRRLRGESYQHIALALRLSPQAVEKHMTRALRQLHDAMDQTTKQNGHTLVGRQENQETDVHEF